ncbi:MAG: hypothetical protein R3C14_01320 [Caldilineaceae bacterium]
MAKSTPELIDALRATAARLADGAQYEWGHMGRCNCGHLVQTLTNMSSYEIVQSTDFVLGEWSEHARDYCEGTGHKMDDIFLTLQQVGFDYWDVIHLENLSDQRVLQRLQPQMRYPRRNCVTDVICYIETMADLLAEEQAMADVEVAPVA